MSAILEAILDLRLARLNEHLPCEVLRMGDRQHAALDGHLRRLMGWCSVPPGTPLERMMGMRVEQVESPDYLEIQ